MSEEACTKSEIEVFRPINVQVAMTSGKWNVHYPTNSYNAGTTNIEFVIPGTSNEVIDMNNTSIYIKGKIVKGDGSVLEATDVVMPVNNLLGALFRNVELSINGQLLTRSTREYPYKDQLLKLTQNFATPNGSSKGQLRMAGFLMDTPGKQDTPATNTSGKLRHAWIAESKSFELRGRPCVDLFDCERAMIPGADMQLKFYLNDPEFYLIDPTATNTFKLQLEAVELYVRRITIGDTFVSEIKSNLKTKNAIYPFTRREMISMSIANGDSSFVKENVFRGQLATRYFFVLVNGGAFNGLITKSPFNFQHYGVTEIALYENGQSVSQHLPLKLSITTDETISMNAYYMLLESTGAIGDRANVTPIDYEQFVAGNTIFCFTRSPDLCHGEAHSPNQVGNLTLRITFAKATTEAITCICMAEFDSRIQITNEKNIITDYSV